MASPSGDVITELMKLYNTMYRPQAESLIRSDLTKPVDERTPSTWGHSHLDMLRIALVSSARCCRDPHLPEFWDMFLAITTVFPLFGGLRGGFIADQIEFKHIFHGLPSHGWKHKRVLRLRDVPHVRHILRLADPCSQPTIREFESYVVDLERINTILLKRELVLTGRATVIDPHGPTAWLCSRAPLWVVAVLCNFLG